MQWLAEGDCLVLWGKVILGIYVRVSYHFWLISDKRCDYILDFDRILKNSSMNRWIYYCANRQTRTRKQVDMDACELDVL
ncbi:hypothetical protein SORBI_3006G261650 [Sorghum bicolor]|uniref:Uncharacterized protein n=1 Tax=Sorghum bicolor TaxID=4558 RepID=A0A1Z5RG33_SORBI|nr:hypothetical protein SORBI_3006G261650 [Sorghum bicolor]